MIFWLGVYMQPHEPRLAIDYGTACTQAVLAWPDGRWLPLSFDGGFELSNAVHTGPQPGSPAWVLVGAAAWRHAESAPDGLLAAPMRAGTGSVQLAGADVEVADLVSATLRYVADAAAQAAGAAVTDVRMVVPAGWGPKRRTWLRHAAHQAGLGQPRLVEAPVAAANRLLAGGVQVPVGQFLLVCDVGAGAEATVLRRGPTGFEVLSTISDPDAGGAHVDDLLTAALIAAAAIPPERAGTAASAVRAAKEALSQQAVVTMPLPSAPAVVVSGALLHDAAQPVYKRVAELAAAAVTNAERTPEQLAGVYCIGAASALPGVAQAVGDALAVTAQVLTQPGFAAVLGAAEAGGPTAVPAGPAAAAARLPALRRLSGIAASGVASLLLYAQFVFTAAFFNGTPELQRPYYYVLATWGELTMAAVFALLSCLQAGSFFTAALRYNWQQLHPPSASGTPGAAADAQPATAGGIAVAAGAGVAIAGLYAVIAAVSFGISVDAPLRWALLPIAPIALTAAGAAWLAARRRSTPAAGWDAYLAFPVSSTVAAGTGTALIAIWWAGGAPTVLTGWTDAAARIGGLLVGVAVACALVQPIMLRILLGVPLGLFGLVSIGPGATGILAVVYAIAATGWWAQRAWNLTRTSPAGDHAH